MMFSFYGEKLPKVTVGKIHKHPPHSSLTRELGKNAREAFLGKDVASKLKKEDIQAVSERKSKRRDFCTHCRKMQSENASEKFQVCKRCRETMQRYVLYCSR